MARPHRRDRWRKLAFRCLDRCPSSTSRPSLRREHQRHRASRSSGCRSWVCWGVSARGHPSISGRQCRDSSSDDVSRGHPRHFPLGTHTAGGHSSVSIEHRTADCLGDRRGGRRARGQNHDVKSLEPRMDCRSGRVPSLCGGHCSTPWRTAEVPGICQNMASRRLRRKSSPNGRTSVCRVDRSHLPCH